MRKGSTLQEGTSSAWEEDQTPTVGLRTLGSQDLGAEEEVLLKFTSGDNPLA